MRSSTELDQLTRKQPTKVSKNSESQSGKGSKLKDYPEIKTDKNSVGSTPKPVVEAVGKKRYKGMPMPRKNSIETQINEDIRIDQNSPSVKMLSAKNKQI